MIGTVSTRDPDPSLADRIRSAVPRDDEGAQAYLQVGARLDVVSAVHAEPAAVAWRSLHATWDRPWIIAMGQDPAAVARCVVALVEEGGLPEGITVERLAFTHLPPRIRPVEHWEWDWWYTTSAPAVRRGEDRVIGLEPHDPRIPALLAVASPDAMIRPGDPRIRGWWAVIGRVARRGAPRRRRAPTGPDDPHSPDAPLPRRSSWPSPRSRRCVPGSRTSGRSRPIPTGAAGDCRVICAPA